MLTTAHIGTTSGYGSAGDALYLGLRTDLRQQAGRADHIQGPAPSRKEAPSTILPARATVEQTGTEFQLAYDRHDGSLVVLVLDKGTSALLHRLPANEFIGIAGVYPKTGGFLHEVA
jgi:hypothetical protein